MAVSKRAVVGYILAAITITAIALGLGLHYRFKDKKSEPELDTKPPTSSTKPPTPKVFPSAGSALDFFGIDDALKIRWYHGANTLAEMEEALSEDYQMLEGDIILNWYGLPNQTTEPVMSHPPLVTSDNTLLNWLESILARPDKAPKLDFKGGDVMESSLQVLQSVSHLVNHPIWANADIVNGPGTDKEPIDSVSVFSLVNQYFPNMTLSLGWTTGCCNDLYTRQHMETMWTKIQNISQPVTLPARAALLRDSWEQYKWLLRKDPTRLSITVWAPWAKSGPTESWEGATPYDMLYVRNDIDKRMIYYDLPGPKFETFRRLAVTGGSPFNHFDGMAGVRDGILVTWAHRVNSQEALRQAFASNINMLETDVLLRGQGTENQTDIPIMAHPPETDSDITLQEWLTKVVNTTKGIKLDFKSNEVILPAMEVLNSFSGQFKQPIWLNADILEGPNKVGPPNINATEFKQIILQNFPECTFSIGWTTSNGTGGYTQEMTQAMAAYAADLEQPITFPVRAMLVRRSWDNLKALLDQSRAYTLSIWSNNDPVDPDDLVFVRQNYDIDRVYYDLPEWLMNAFLERLKAVA